MKRKNNFMQMQMECNLMQKRMLEFQDNCYNSTSFFEMHKEKKEIKRNNYVFVWIIRRAVIRE